MEFIKYEIKRGDTLESIALEYSLNVTELINFHNLYCGTTNFIIGNKLPIHLQYLLLERKLKRKKNEAIEKRSIRKRQGTDANSLIPQKLKTEYHSIVIQKRVYCGKKFLRRKG